MLRWDPSNSKNELFLVKSDDRKFNNTSKKYEEFATGIEQVLNLSRSTLYISIADTWWAKKVEQKMVQWRQWNKHWLKYIQLAFTSYNNMCSL